MGTNDTDDPGAPAPAPTEDQAADQQADRDAPPVPDDPTPASQDAYEQKTTELDWIHVPEGEEWFQVRTVTPLKLLRTASKHGVLELLDADDDFDMEGAVRDGRWDAFVESMIVPNIVKPTVYWSDESHLDADDPEQDPDVFDLAALEPEDLFELVQGLSGVSKAELQEEMDDKFPG